MNTIECGTPAACLGRHVGRYLSVNNHQLYQSLFFQSSCIVNEPFLLCFKKSKCHMTFFVFVLVNNTCKRDKGRHVKRRGTPWEMSMLWAWLSIVRDANASIKAIKFISHLSSNQRIAFFYRHLQEFEGCSSSVQSGQPRHKAINYTSLPDCVIIDILGQIQKLCLWCVVIDSIK